MNKLSTQPYKGARDFYPEEMRIRNYIFDIWKDVCKSYGYEEYDGPFLESFDLYAAKTGGELVNEQLYSFKDRGNRKLAIRPEMTPTLARMVAAKYKTLDKPIRWFSIPNLWRYEKPQKGRLREHYQLNVDIFGVGGVEADFEIISLGIDFLLKAGSKEGSFETRVNNRLFMDDVFKQYEIKEKKRIEVSKIIDKKQKVSDSDFEGMLKDAKLNDSQVKNLLEFLNSPTKMLKDLENSSDGAKEITKLLQLAKESGKDKYIKFDPSVVRGLDYYTRNVFELYDLSPENTRAMYGGGRYDDLVEMFNGNKLSGVGFGMGDVTFKNFLETWDLLPDFEGSFEYFVTLWPTENAAITAITSTVTNTLRNKGKTVSTWLEPDTKLDKQLKYADKKGASFSIIVGEDELKKGTVTVKNMKTQKQNTIKLDEFLND